MHTLALIALAIGGGFLLLIVALSIVGPRDPGGRLSDNRGPIVPYGDDGGEG
jgi:hypothetical protein